MPILPECMPETSTFFFIGQTFFRRNATNKGIVQMIFRFFDEGTCLQRYCLIYIKVSSYKDTAVSLPKGRATVVQLSLYDLSKTEKTMVNLK